MLQPLRKQKHFINHIRVYTIFSIQFHLFICYLYHLSFRVMRKLTLGERWGTLWTGCQFVTGLHTQRWTNIHIGTSSLEWTVFLIWMSLQCERKYKHANNTYTGTERMCKLHTERLQWVTRLEPRTFMLLGHHVILQFMWWDQEF